MTCPDLVITGPTTNELVSTTYKYDDAGCPGQCCVLQESAGAYVSVFPIPMPGPTQVTTEEILCPDGKPGTRTTTRNTWSWKRRWKVVNNFKATCPGVACPDVVNYGPVLDFHSTTIVTVNDDCDEIDA